MRKKALFLSVAAMTLFVTVIQAKQAKVHSRFVSESIPHLPNFLGNNICLGIDVPSDQKKWDQTRIFTSSDLLRNTATHRIVLDRGDEISVEESLVGEKDCVGLPLNVAQWTSPTSANFCLKSWKENRFIKVKFSANYQKDNREAISQVLYAIGPCDLGTGDHYQYGDVLKVDSIHVQRPR